MFMLDPLYCTFLTVLGRLDIFVNGKSIKAKEVISIENIDQARLSFSKCHSENSGMGWGEEGELATSDDVSK